MNNNDSTFEDEDEIVSEVDLDLFLDKVEEEMNQFKLTILRKSKQEIYDANYEIYFYENVYDFLLNFDIGDLYTGNWNECVDELNKRENIIANLWDYYINTEYMSINSYEDISDFISNYIQTMKEE